MESVTVALVDYGMAGLFIAFMVWQYMQNQKRMDALQDKFLESIDKVRKENKDNEEHIRSRYDKVIQVYQADKDTLLSELKDTISGLTQSVNSLSEMEKNTLIKIDQIDDTIDEVKRILDQQEQTRKAEKEAKLIALANQQTNLKK